MGLKNMALPFRKKKPVVPELVITEIVGYEHAPDTSMDMEVLRTKHSVLVMRNRGGLLTTYSFTDQEARALVALLNKALA